MKELQNSENPYAPPIHVPSAVKLPSFETGGRAERRIWMINIALLIATIPAGVGALVFIRSIAFVSLIFGPVCLVVLIVARVKRLPRVTYYIPAALLMIVLLVFAVVNLWDMSPRQAQVPIGRACAAAAILMQTGWFLVFKFRPQPAIASQTNPESTTPPTEGLALSQETEIES